MPSPTHLPMEFLREYTDFPCLLLVSAHFAQNLAVTDGMEEALLSARGDALFAIPFDGFTTGCVGAVAEVPRQLLPDIRSRRPAMAVFADDEIAAMEEGTYALPLSGAEMKRLMQSLHWGEFIGRMEIAIYPRLELLGAIAGSLRGVPPADRTDDHALLGDGYRLALALLDFEESRKTRWATGDREGLDAARERVLGHARLVGLLEEEGWRIPSEEAPVVIQKLIQLDLGNWLAVAMGVIRSERPLPEPVPVPFILAHRPEPDESAPPNGLFLASDRYLWHLRAAAFKHSITGDAGGPNGFWLTFAHEHAHAFFIGQDPNFSCLADHPELVIFASEDDEAAHELIRRKRLPKAPLLGRDDRSYKQLVFEALVPYQAPPEGRRATLAYFQDLPLGSYSDESMVAQPLATFAQSFPAMREEAGGTREQLLWRALRFARFCEEHLAEGTYSDPDFSDWLTLAQDVAWLGLREDGSLTPEGALARMTEADRRWMGDHFHVIARAHHLYQRHASPPPVENTGTEIHDLATRAAVAALATPPPAPASAPPEAPRPFLPAMPGEGRVILLDDPPPGDATEHGEIERYRPLREEVPFTPMPDLAKLKTRLEADIPWAKPVIDRIISGMALLALGDQPRFRLEPLLLLGPPGYGKTRLARKIAQFSKAVYRLTTAADGSSTTLSGAGRGWKGGRPALPISTILENGRANPLICVDEIGLDRDRSDGSRGVSGVLLSMLESESAKLYFDPFLMTPTDISAVNWILCSNQPDLPAALLSRVTVLEMPIPGEEHFDGLLKAVTKEVREDAQIGREVALPELGEEAENHLRRLFAAREISIRELSRAVRRAMGEGAARRRGLSTLSSLEAVRAELAKVQEERAPERAPIGFRL